jgi:hypothetical protein
MLVDARFIPNYQVLYLSSLTYYIFHQSRFIVRTVSKIQEIPSGLGQLRVRDGWLRVLLFVQEHRP